MNQATVIYIIDDNTIDSLLVEKFLRQELTMVDIYIFPSAHLALERLKKLDPFSSQYPHLILLDKVMPAIDGWQFMESFYELNKGREVNCKVILLSSLEDEYDLAKKLQYQVDMVAK